MRILYIHQYFKIPSEPGGTRSYWIAQELIRSGHEVTVITANPAMTFNREVKQIDGIKVVYLKGVYNQSMSVSQRLKVFLGFVWKSIREAQRYKDTDLVIATSTPLTVGITALYIKKVGKVPYIFEVRDLWPEVPIQMAAFKNPLIIKAARWFEKKIYANAEHIITLSPGMQNGVMRYIPKEKISMIPNMAKVDVFWPREKNLNLLRNLDLKDNSFKVIHFGSIGLANGAEYIINAAEALKNYNDVEFIFIGSGSMEAYLKKLCDQYMLGNVRFLGEFPMKETSEIVNLCDISVVSFKNLPILYTNSPNKLFDSMSAGKPIIVNSAGWTKKLVEDNKCGLFVNPEAPEELADAVLYLKNNPNIAEAMGKASRRLAENKYDKTILCKRVSDIVQSIDKFRCTKSG